MAKVEWVKIYTEMLDNKKIGKIRRLPKGDTYFTIWVYCILIAGKSNKEGRLYQTENCPYSIEELALDYNFEKEMVTNAVEMFLKNDMIEEELGIISIKNWGEYQNVEGLDLIRKQNRERVARYREKKQNPAIKEMLDKIYRKE